MVKQSFFKCNCKQFRDFNVLQSIILKVYENLEESLQASCTVDQVWSGVDPKMQHKQQGRVCFQRLYCNRQQMREGSWNSGLKEQDLDEGQAGGHQRRTG